MKSKECQTRTCDCDSRSLTEARRLDAHTHDKLGSTALSLLTKKQMPRPPWCSLNRRSGARVPSRESLRVRSSSFVPEGECCPRLSLLRKTCLRHSFHTLLFTFVAPRPDLFLVSVTALNHLKWLSHSILIFSLFFFEKKRPE